MKAACAVEIKRARFHLRDGEGKQWKLVSPKEAISRVLKADEVYTYNPNSRKQFEKEFAALRYRSKVALIRLRPPPSGFSLFPNAQKGTGCESAGPGPKHRRAPAASGNPSQLATQKTSHRFSRINPIRKLKPANEAMSGLLPCLIRSVSIRVNLWLILSS